MNTVEEMKMMVAELNYHTKLYEEGHPIWSDKEWDEHYFRLMDFEKKTGIVMLDSPTQKVNYEVVNELKKVRHNHPMLSLDKTKNLREFMGYFDPSKDVVGMLKLDGLTCSLRYLNGKLVSAETRGNGEVGENILHNAKVIPSIPKYIKYKEELIVDGEIICTEENFKEFSDEYANSRNFASGSIRLLDSKECSKRNLTFIVWNIVKGLEGNSFMHKLQQVENEGFEVVPWTSSLDWDWAEYLQDEAKKLGYPIDGLVGRYDDIAYGESLGATDHHARAAYAFKFYDELYPSTLLNIIYEPSRVGLLTPVAVFDPINIEGTLISKCSLFNISVLKEKLKKPFVGQKIWVTKRNQIIPYIEYAEDENGNPI